MLLSSHLLHEVQATVDHLVVISGGAVVAVRPAGRSARQLHASLVRSPDPDGTGRALRAARIDYVAGPDDAFTVDVAGRSGHHRGDRARRASITRCCSPSCASPTPSGLEQLFFSLTAATADHSQEAAA